MPTGSSSVVIGSIAALTGHFRAISPDLQRSMAERAHARTVEVDSSHAVMVTTQTPWSG